MKSVKTIKVGNKYQSNNSGEFEIIADLGILPYSTHNCSTFRIRFSETGYELNAPGYVILGGNIKDPYRKSIFGVACIGEPKACPEEYHDLYIIWFNILKRLYNPTDKMYPAYGGYWS